jgi:biopolymer transport protein ExbB
VMQINNDHKLARYSLALTVLLFISAWLNTPWSLAQDISPAIKADEIQAVMQDQPEASEVSPESESPGIDLLTLVTRGGAFMIPIGIMSLMVVALAFEKFMSLRPKKILPSELANELEDLATPLDRFSPGVALQSCREFPSPASRVVTAMLLRTGQPLAEIERTAHETMEREADQQASSIRWLTLAAAATPLMGLLGTVWGMIVAFHESTALTADRSRSEQLSEGIYTALVTTLSGLIVAIPAAILALYLENRLAKLFHQIEEFAFRIAPALAPYAGLQRLDEDGVLHSLDRKPSMMPETPQPPPPPRSVKDKRSGVKAG